MRHPDPKLEIEQMIEKQMIQRGIIEPRLLDAIRAVPRHLFVADEYRALAYSDCPLPIGYGQTISQPYIVALMISELHLTGTEKVLEVGTGCGYQTAVLAHLASEITTIEIIPDLLVKAERTIQSLQLENVRLFQGDGSLGWIMNAPYDAILVSAAAPKIPQPLLEQLAEGGKLIIPIGTRSYQQLEIWTRNGANFSMELNIPVSFVPLRGKHGWQAL